MSLHFPALCFDSLQGGWGVGRAEVWKGEAMLQSSSLQNSHCWEPVGQGKLIIVGGCIASSLFLQEQKSGCSEMKEGLPRALPSPFLPILKTPLSRLLGPQNEWENLVLRSCWMEEQALKVKGQNKKDFLFLQLNFITISS